jgi:recombination protein RecA
MYQYDAKKKATLEETVKSINKTFGAGSVQWLDAAPITGAELLKTGWPKLDECLGGGVGRGRIVELFGQESAGKTTLATSIMIMGQRTGQQVAMIDAEHAFDPRYARQLGLDTGKLYLAQPDNGEQALEIADQLIQTGAFSVVVIDSVAALVPKAELEGAMGEAKMGLHARLMGQACRKLAGSIARTGTVVVFINQLREKIGVMFGDPRVTTGGNALKFYASQRVEISKKAVLKEGDAVVGNKIGFKVIKNKLAPPFKTGEVDFFFGRGLDAIGDMLTSAMEKGVIVKKGSWLYLDGVNIGQGKDQVKAMLEDNPDMVEEIKNKLLKFKK